MQIEISASGTPGQVNADVATQAKAAAASNPEAWPTLVSTRDYIASHIAKAGESDGVSVTAVIAVEIAIAPSSQPTPSVGAPVAEPEEPDGN